MSDLQILAATVLANFTTVRIPRCAILDVLNTGPVAQASAQVAIACAHS